MPKTAATKRHQKLITDFLYRSSIDPHDSERVTELLDQYFSLRELQTSGHRESLQTRNNHSPPVISIPDSASYRPPMIIEIQFNNSSLEKSGNVPPLITLDDSPKEIEVVSTNTIPKITQVRSLPRIISSVKLTNHRVKFVKDVVPK